MTAKRERAEWMMPADEAILEFLRTEPPDYAPLIANRLGMHLQYVDRRCKKLVEYGLLEPVTNEVIYGITDRGVRYLDGELDAATLTKPPTDVDGHTDSEI